MWSCWHLSGVRNPGSLEHCNSFLFLGLVCFLDNSEVGMGGRREEEGGGGVASCKKLKLYIN